MNFENRLKDLLILCIPDKKGRYTMFPQCTCLFRLYGFGVPTTPIRLFTCYTTPLCKAPFRENVPKLV